MPLEHYVGRLCEEFGALPSAILHELGRVPVGFLEQVIEYRHYAAAKMANDVDRSATGWRSSPMRQLAKEIEHELVADALARKTHG